MRIKTITVTLDSEGRVDGLVVPEGTQVQIINALDHEKFYAYTGAISAIGWTSYEVDPDDGSVYVEAPELDGLRNEP